MGGREPAGLVAAGFVAAVTVDGAERVSLAELVRRAAELAGSGGRRMLGICGAPGVGKSTVAGRIVAGLGDRAVLVGMDGFHLAHAELARLGRLDRKGAPDTFDAAGYVALLDRLRHNGFVHGVGDPAAVTVYAPEFRRELEEPVAGAVPVPPTVPLVVTEGNYLLLPSEPWCRIRSLLDEIWYLEDDHDERLDRLAARHERYGLTRSAARAKALGSDQRNAELIVPSAAGADHVFRLETLPKSRTHG